MAATPIRIWVHNGTGWQSATGGTPVGYSGVHVYQTGWQNCQRVYNYTTSWQTNWADLDNQTSPNTFTVSDFDLGTPWNTGVGFRLLGDGSVDKYTNDTNWVGTSNWWDYDMGYEFEVKFTRDSGVAADTEPTLNTWLALTDPSTTRTVQDLNSGSTVFNRTQVYTYSIREKSTAPATGHESATVTLEQSAEGNQ